MQVECCAHSKGSRNGVIISTDQKGKGEEMEWGLQLAILLPFPLLSANEP